MGRLEDFTQEDWEKLKRKAEVYFLGLDIEDQRRKVGKFLYKCGDAMMEIYDRIPRVFSVNPDSTLAEGHEYDNLIATLDNHFNRPTNLRLERYRLRQIKQEATESMDSYLLRLRGQTQKCGFTDEERSDEEIMQALLGGTSQESLRDRILAEPGLNLTTALAIGRFSEEKREVRREFALTAPAVYRTDRSAETRKFNPGSKRSAEEDWKCFNCDFPGHVAENKNCPARNETCRECGIRGHYKRCCPILRHERRNWRSSGPPDAKRHKQLFRLEAGKDDHSSDDSDDGVAHCFMIGTSGCYKMIFEIGRVETRLLVDSGAKANLLRLKTWDTLVKKRAELFNLDLNCANKVSGIIMGSSLEISHAFEAKVTIGEFSEVAKFLVSENAAEDILSSDMAKKLKCLAVGYKVVDQVIHCPRE